MGDKTPADLILFSSMELRVDNSSLTGESEPQERRALLNGSFNPVIEAENVVSLRLLRSWFPNIGFKFYRCSTQPLLSMERAGEVSILDIGRSSDG